MRQARERQKRRRAAGGAEWKDAAHLSFLANFLLCSCFFVTRRY
jgi:hypothetical protein